MTNFFFKRLRNTFQLLVSSVLLLHSATWQIGLCKFHRNSEQSKFDNVITNIQNNLGTMQVFKSDLELTLNNRCKTHKYFV